MAKIKIDVVPEVGFTKSGTLPAVTVMENLSAFYVCSKTLHCICEAPEYCLNSKVDKGATA